MKFAARIGASIIIASTGLISNAKQEKKINNLQYLASVKYFDFSIKYKLGRVNANKPISE